MTLNPLPSARTFPTTLRQALLNAAATRRRQLAEMRPHDPTNLVAAAHRLSVERIRDQVHLALDRMDSGTYGDCGDCGGTISLQTLLEKAWTLRCDWCTAR